MPRRPGKDGAVKGDTITVRVDPKVKFALDLLARAQNRTISSLVVTAVENLFSGTDNPQVKEEHNVAEDIWYLAKEVWDPLYPVRLAKLAERMPKYLTPDEEFVWKAISADRPRYLSGEYGGPNEGALMADWEEIKAKAKKLQETFGNAG